MKDVMLEQIIYTHIYGHTIFDSFGPLVSFVYV